MKTNKVILIIVLALILTGLIILILNIWGFIEDRRTISRMLLTITILLLGTCLYAGINSLTNKPKTLIAMTLLLSAFITLSTFSMKFYDIQVKRVFVMELILSATPTKILISEEIKQRHLLNQSADKILDFQNYSNIENEGSSFIQTTRDGRVIIYGERHGVFITLQPEWNGTDVTWSCFGQPTKLMPSECRMQDSNQSD